MSRWVVLLLSALVACATSRVTAPDLGLAERFEIVAFALAEPPSYDTLWRWDRPISVRYIGPDDYRQDVYDHVALLGELTGKVVVIEGDYSNMVVEISNRDTPNTCQLHTSTTEQAVIHIWSALPDRHIRHCIREEITQSLGLLGDLDSVFGSRSDTVFASYTNTVDLTEHDIALIKILYDRRLHHGMPRSEAMPIVRQIVAEMEAEQEAKIKSDRVD